jgi:hypothetical protein
MAERVSWDGSLPPFETPAVDPKTGQWHPAWRPIIEMLAGRTGGDFDEAFRASADADATRSQFAEISRAVEILGGQIASLRDALTASNFDEARINRLEADVKGLTGLVSGLDATTRSDGVFSEASSIDLRVKTLTVDNASNLKGAAKLGGAASTVGFFGATGSAKLTPTMTNANGDIGGLTISNPPTQAEVQAFRNATEVLADDVRALKASLQTYSLIG